MFGLTIPQVLAQGVAVVIIILMAISAQLKTQKMFLFYRVAINSLYVLHYALLSATTAVAITIVCVTRTLIFFLYKRAEKEMPKWLLIIIFAVAIGLGIATWDNWLSIIPILATIAFTIGQLQQNVQTTRKTVIIGDFGWLIYNIFYFGYMDLIGRIVEITSCSIAVYKNRKKEES